MKKLHLICILLISLFSFNTILAQQQKHKKRKRLHQVLNAQQKEILLKNRELIKENRVKIEASYTKEQLSIINDKELDGHSKMNALRKTLTTEQKEAFKKNRAIIEKNKQAIKESLSEEQKEKLREYRRRNQENRDLKSIIRGPVGRHNHNGLKKGARNNKI